MPPPAILSGEEVASLVERISDVPATQDQIQPAGFDLTVSRIFSYIRTKYTLGRSRTENSMLDEVALLEGHFELAEGAYVVELNEKTTIPPDAIGIVLPRSTLLRNGLDVRAALFDPGYSGQPKVMLVCHRPARIQRFARIAQLVIIKSDKRFEKQYAGRYQGERGVVTR